MTASVARFPGMTRGTPDAMPSREQTAIALAIASRRWNHAQAVPEAVALEAECVEAWHSRTKGLTGAILKSRGDSYGREIGLGTKPMALADLCEAAVCGGAEGREAVREVLGVLAGRLRDQKPGTVGEAVADFARETGEVADALMRGRTDGDIEREAREAIERGNRLLEVLASRRKATNELAELLGGKAK